MVTAFADAARSVVVQLRQAVHQRYEAAQPPARDGARPSGTGTPATLAELTLLVDRLELQLTPLMAAATTGSKAGALPEPAALLDTLVAVADASVRWCSATTIQGHGASRERTNGTGWRTVGQVVDPAVHAIAVYVLHRTWQPWRRTASAWVRYGRVPAVAADFCMALEAR